VSRRIKAASSSRTPKTLQNTKSPNHVFETMVRAFKPSMFSACLAD